MSAAASAASSPVPSAAPSPVRTPGAPGARRLLFVSSVIDGGSGRSQRELAAALAAQGREVRFLVDAGTSSVLRRRLLEELTDASVRLADSRLARPIDRARSRVGAHVGRRRIDGLAHSVTIAPENAFEATVRQWRPDVVVVSSISRPTWRRVRAVCRRRGIPTALYLREAAAIGHLSAGLSADLLLANSGTLVDDAERLGVRAAMVPSVVRVQPMEFPPTGDVALLVNPLASHGLHIVGPLAAARPDIPIVLQESWALGDRERGDVDRLVCDHPNVSFRPYDPRPGVLFRDAAVLLAPHQIDNRPRTILEAQANGLPVIASDLPGLVEAVGEGGLVIPPDAGPDRWLGSLASIWDHTSFRLDLSDRARMHAARPEVRPDLVAARFAELVDSLIDQKSSMSPIASRN